MFLLFVLLLTTVFSDLVSDRMANAKLWIDRSHSNADMLAGYSTSVTIAGVCHHIETVGDFCDRLIAMEYDSIVLNIQILGQIAPVLVWTMYDPFTTKWVATDVLQADFEMNVTGAYNFTLGDYLVKNNTFRLREYITFEPNSPLIKLGYTIHDAAANKAFSLGSSVYPNSFLCQNILFPACNVSNGAGGTYLTDTGFATVDQCTTFLDSLSDNPCPYSQRSNTSACRLLHSVSAILLPEVHCSHVKKDSMVCTDSCLPACSSCDPNAKCVATYPGIPLDFSITYECKCKNGFVGNGTVCQALYCDNDHCPAKEGSYECSSGLCKCTETFTTQPEGYGNKNLCICPDGGKIIYMNDSIPICVPVGKCIQDQSECKIQNYNEVKCETYGLNNFSPVLRDCVCNYGYKGGWEYPCFCDPTRRSVWSNRLGYKVCLTNQECTDSWHCTSQVCNIQANQQIGTCA